MSHLLFAPTGTLKRRTPLYKAVHAELWAWYDTLQKTRQQLRAARKARYKQTGELQ